MLEIGLIGCGNVVKKSHIESYRQLSDLVRIAALVDKSIESSREIAQEFDVQIFSDISQLKDKHLDCVIISLPIGVTFPITRHFLSIGIPCITEKPGAKNYAEAEELVALARKNSTPFSFVQNYLFGSKQLQTFASLDSIGDVKFVRLESPNSGYGSQDSSFDMAWRHDRTMSGERGCLQNHGFHEIYLALHLNKNPVDRVFAAKQNICYKTDLEDLANVSLIHRNHGISQITVGFLHGREAKRVEEVHGEYGTISLENPPQTLQIKKEYSHTRYFRERFMELTSQGTFYDNVNEFLEIHKILDAAYKSMETGEVVKLC